MAPGRGCEGRGWEEVLRGQVAEMTRVNVNEGGELGTPSFWGKTWQLCTGGGWRKTLVRR